MKNTTLAKVIMNWKSLFKPEGKPFSALTAGLAVFLTLLFLLSQSVSLVDKMELSPDHMFNPGHLSNYPLIHLSWAHLIFNLLSLMVPLNLFESQHGTVHTGVVLNLVAVFTGLLYCIVGKLLYPHASVVGASGWCFTLFGYFSWKASLAIPRKQFMKTQYHFPTVLSPLLILAIITAIFPDASFWGHLAGLAIGYLIAWKEKLFSKLVPPSWLIIKIEDKLDAGISRIPGFVKYYKETEMEEVDRSDFSWMFEPNVTLPLHNDSPQQSGAGRVLGTA